ncbi:MAG TPA: sugar ABC transporter substrate-binding protein [Ktedonobacteraceae bacterium]|nr:sugar ABC transporter substrate-binding protein [Ktedonobacteraceae bacterium]
MMANRSLSTEELSKPRTRRDVLKLGGSLAASTFAVPTILSACDTKNATPKTLQVYWNTGHMFDAYASVTQQFEKDHPGWKVNVEPYQWTDMRAKILANFAAKKVPDLVEEPGGWVQEFGLAGNILSLQSYLHASGKQMGFPNDWQANTVTRNSINGQVYGIQLHLTCVLLFYNKDLLAKAGIKQPPTTWSEFLAAAQELTHDNVYGCGVNANVWPWLMQNGVQYYDPANNVVPMTTPETYEALQFQADLVHKYKVSPTPTSLTDASTTQPLFSAQRVAMFLTGPWDIKPILTSSPNLHWDIAQALTKKVQATSTAGTSLFIPKGAKNPEMAWELLQRYVALDTEIAVSKEARMPMPRKSWAASPQIQALNRIAPFAQGLSYAQSSSGELDRTGHSGAIGTLFTNAFEDIIYRSRPVPETMQQFVASANKLLKK